MTLRSRRMLWLVAGLIVAAGVSVALLLRGRQHRDMPPAFIVGLRPVSADAAIVVWRANSPVRGWVGRIDTHGGIAWVQPLPAVSRSVGPYNGVTVVGDVVAVRYSHGEYLEERDQALAAFSITNGRPLWDIVLTPFQPKQFDGGGHSQPDLESYASTLAIGDKWLATWASDGAHNQFAGIEVATGSIVSRATLPDNEINRSPRVLGDHVVTSVSGEALVADAARQHALETIQATFEPCVIGDELVTLQGDALVAYRGANPAARRTIVAPFHPVADVPGVSVLRCGRYRDRMVFLVSTFEVGARKVIVITDAAGTVLHRIDLGQDLAWDAGGDGMGSYPESAPLSGELTRFMPYPLLVRSTESDARTDRLLMLDLEEGKIAWQGPQDDQLLHSRLFHVGSHSYRFEPWPSWTLSVFDGNTGNLVAASQLHAYDGIGDVRAFAIADGRVWVHSGAYVPIDATAYAVLDAATLAPAFVRGVELKDVTTQQRAALGR